MLFKKMVRTLWHYKAQFISMVIMVALGIGVFLGFCGEYYSIEKDTAYFYEKTNLADYRLVYEKGFSEDERDKIKNIEGIDKVSRYLSIKMNEKKDNDTLMVTITENFEVSNFMIMEGSDYDSSSKDGIWLNDRYAKLNNYKIGDEMTLKYLGLELKGKVIGLVKSSEYLICLPDSNQVMPDYKTSGFLYVSPEFAIDKLGFVIYPQINIISNIDKKTLQEEANRLLGRTTLLITKNEVASYSEAQGEASEGKTMASILPVIFLGIAFLTMITTLQRITINEKTQIGTLKALGFRDKKIIRHYTTYGLFVGLIGSVLGIGLGYFIAWFIFNPNGSMGTYFDIPLWTIRMPFWVIFVVIGVILLLGLISYLSTKKMLVGSASDALRPYQPKAMRRLKLEDSKLWHNLSFATKWNLRDLFRHKARTLMSLFGVFGCTVLIVASFLINDSMNSYVDSFYKNAMNYETRISLVDEITNDKAKEMANHYNADYSADIAVEYMDEAIALEIYKVDNNLVKFIDLDLKDFKLTDDGAYIGTRMRDQYNLKVGDKIKVAVYGTEITYEIRIAGIMRSLTKGLVITEKYAENENIAYFIDQLYTSKSVEEINNEGLYKNDIALLKSKNDIIKSFDSFMEVMNVMIIALIVLSIILGVVVLYNLGTMSYFERYRELSTLKVVGFKDKKIGKLLITQNMWITIIGIIIGYPAGFGITIGLVKALAGEYEISVTAGWMTYLLPFVISFSVSLFVSYLVSIKSKKINMVEALKVPE